MKSFLIILAFLPLAANCQTSNPASTKKVELGVTFSPDYCYRTIKSDGSELGNWFTSSRDDHEIPKAGYTTGVEFVMHMNKRLAMETGVLFSDKGFKTKKTDFNPENTNDPLVPSSYRSIYKFQYLDVPFKANYYILTGKIKLIVSAGVSANIRIRMSSTSILYWDDGTSTVDSQNMDDNFRRINLAAIAGFGFHYDVTDKIGFRLEPTFRHSIISITDAPIKGYLYSAGIHAGVFYTL